MATASAAAGDAGLVSRPSLTLKRRLDASRDEIYAAVKMRPNETVAFSWITYKSHAQRDRINVKVMADPRLKKMMTQQAAPFDGKRMIYGGFESLVKVQAASRPRRMPAGCG
jgi:hypothetical protein